MFSKHGTTLSVCSNTLTGAHSIMSQPSISIGSIDYLTSNPTNIQIHKVNNGFVLRCAGQEGGLAEAYIAQTIEEVNQIITTKLVTRKMEGK